jgi:hypothetical protein
LAGSACGVKHTTRRPGLNGKAFLYVPDGYLPLRQVSGSAHGFGLEKIGDNLWVQKVRFEEAKTDWSIGFERADQVRVAQ